MFTRPRIGPWLSAAVLSLVTTQGVAQAVPSPNLDLSALGQVALAGNFDAVSLYQRAGQTEGYTNNNGTQSVVAQLPNGFYEKMATTDASIDAMCPFVLKNGTLVGVIVAGNFTSIGGVDTRSVALINADTFEITPQVGIQGSVAAVLCDQDTEMVYVGGSFEASTSTNAITWIAAGSWANLPFSGFDGPITSIAKGTDGHIIFGGSFTGLGNTSLTTNETSREEAQVINIGSATISSVGNTTSGNNIVCPPATASDPWLLRDNSAGSWTAAFRYGFNPSKVRLWNAKNGRGTKTWRFTALPINGIMNLTYVDPATGRTEYCDATCPLANNASVEYQDFTFVNSVGMNEFRIDVSDWYGSGGGLDGIQLFQSEIFSYAIESFNEPSCSGSTTLSTATTTGPWYVTPSRNSNSDYLTVVTGPTTVQSTQIVFEPDVKETGNYTVIVYTPGCRQDSSCSARAIVNVTGSLTTSRGQSFSELVYQTNDFDKYDIVYTGRIEASSSSFRPSVTLSPSGQITDQLIVASRIRFSLIDSTGGLNGLYDFDPNQVTVSSDFSQSAINNAGNTLREDAQIAAMVTHDRTLYIAGQFSSNNVSNILSFANNQVSPLPNGGLNANVAAMYATSDYLYAGGNFTGTSSNGPSGLNNVAAYRYSDNTWTSLGAGLDGPVDRVLPLYLNISGTDNETVIGLGGSFSNILASGDTPSTSVDGLAIWVPSANAWLENLDIPKEIYVGQLVAQTTLPNGTWIGAGTLTSLGQAIRDAVALRQSSGNTQLQQLPIAVTAASNSSLRMVTQRVTVDSQNITSGIVTGLFYNNDGRNVTVLGGHFSAVGNNTAAIENLLFLNGSRSNTVTGLPSGIDSNSTFMSLAVLNDMLVAGGMVTGRVNDASINGLVMYDLHTAAYRSVQPAALVGQDAVIVNAITSQPSTSNIYVGGAFDMTSQGLACQSVCMYDTDSNQWASVGGQLGGTVAALYWVSNTQLLAAGNLTVSGNRTQLAQYNTQQQTWSVRESSQIPGPVTCFAPRTMNADQMWVAGTAINGSQYLMEVDGNNFRPVVAGLEAGTAIRSLQVLPLTQNHGASQYLDRDQSLLVTGSLNLTGYGTASTALFNGTTFTPFLLSSASDGRPGSISQLFTSNVNPLKSGGSHHSRGITVLVALCAALGTIFLIVLIGILVNYVQRRRSGYDAVPTVPYADKNSNINRVPPERLFGSLGQRPGAAPTV